MMGDSSLDRGDDLICRDFLRNVCKRGKKCKFSHPIGDKKMLTSLDVQQERNNFTDVFCHDFQNIECKRGDECKFLHCSRDEQEGFKESGCLPTHLIEEAISKSITPSLPWEIPVCREYLSGECRRGKLCRFRHLSLCKYRKELDHLFGVDTPLSDVCQASQHPEPKRFKSSCGSCSRSSDICKPPTHGCNQSYVAHDSCGHYHTSAPHPRPTCKMIPVNYLTDGCCEHRNPQELLITNSLQDENNLLKKQVFDLQRQLSDLMTANEFLLEQNAALRLIRKNDATLSVQPAPGAPIVASAGPVSIAPVSGSGLPLSTMAIANGTAPQQLVSVSCHAAGQQIMPVTVSGQTGQQIMSVAGQTGQQIMSMTGQTGQQIMSVTGQAGQQIMSGRPTILATAVPVSVSSPASQLLPVSVSMPVSITTVSMASVHPVPPHIVTSLASTDASRNMAMNVSAGTPMLSYPIVTHQALLPTH